MLSDDGDTKATRILGEMADHALTLSHSRHISADRARDLGIDVTALEDDQERDHCPVPFSDVTGRFRPPNRIDKRHRRQSVRTVAPLRATASGP